MLLRLTFLLFLACILRWTTSSTVVYRLRPGKGTAKYNCTSQTLHNDSLNDCTELSHLLQSLPSNQSSTIELVLSPGTYTLTETNINVTYSLYLSGITSQPDSSSTVVIQCNGSSTRPLNNAQISFSTGAVRLLGITFRQCYSMRFNQVESVFINSCTFR